MLSNIKPLIVVLILASLVFAVIRPICLAYMRPETFARRRNVWFLLTTLAFISPTFWIYALVAVPVFWLAGRADENPLALYALTTFVVPNAKFYLPTAFIGQLFDLTQYRILAIVILIPFITRCLKGNSDHSQWRTFLFSALTAFMLLQVAIYFPYESFTASMRRIFLFAVDFLVVFIAFSSIRKREHIADIMASFCVMACIMAVTGIFEWAKGWLLYTGISEVWGDPNVFAWLIRGERLRAQSASTHAINLGYQLALAISFFLYVRERSKSRLTNLSTMSAMIISLYCTASRGPWVTAMLSAVLFMAMRPGAIKKLGGALALTGVAIGLMYLTPLRDTVIDRLPIIGTSDQDTIDYRRQLAELSWSLIMNHPFFGDPFVTTHMESLRQGQGIIDIVNGYIFTLLFTGFVGMTLQGTVLAGSLWVACQALWQGRRGDIDLQIMGTAIVVPFMATLFYVATAGFSATTYMLAGLLVSFSQVKRAENSPVNRSAGLYRPTGLAT